jgi:hypothetical protein
MTLDEAIEHCEEKAQCGTDCRMEHKQLAEWLKELKTLRKKVEDLEENLEYKSRVMDKLSWDEVIEAENEVDAEMAEDEDDGEQIKTIYD